MRGVLLELTGYRVFDSYLRMRCLFLHCSKFDYKLAEATPAATQDTLGRSESLGDCAVAFVAVERDDDESSVTKMAKEIRKHIRKSQAASVVVNPFAHLTAKSSSPDDAHRLTKLLADRLSETADVPIEYSSFGWIKEFTCAVLGEVTAQIWIEIPPRHKDAV